MLIGFLYCVFVVKESGIDGINSCSSSVAKEKPTFRHLFLDYFNFKDFGDILKVVYRKRPDKKRLMLVIGYSVIFFGFGANLGKEFNGYPFGISLINLFTLQETRVVSICTLASSSTLVRSITASLGPSLPSQGLLVSL